MTSRIQIVTCQGVNQGFRAQIRTWTNEVLAKAQPLSDICVTIWATTEELKGFYQRERSELGIITGEETDFLATHEAWRGYPRVHICQERLRGIPDAVIQGAIHHEMAHALHHCSPEYYTFLFSNDLQDKARSIGFDLATLQECVYLLSVAIKDRDVVQWLAEIELSSGQLSLLQYLIADVEEERQAWEMVSDSSVLNRVVFAALLKTLIPIETLVLAGVELAQVLKDQWNEAYGWLSESERRRLFELAKNILNVEADTFQERLEESSFRLISY